MNNPNPVIEIYNGKLINNPEKTATQTGFTCKLILEVTTTTKVKNRYTVYVTNPSAIEYVTTKAVKGAVIKVIGELMQYQDDINGIIMPINRVNAYHVDIIFNGRFHDNKHSGETTDADKTPA